MATKTKHRITRQKCKDSISGVCSRCGGDLEPIETVDNSRNPTYWAGCVKCCCFDNGVSERVYEIAKRMVVEHYCRPYSHIGIMKNDTEETKKYKTESQISGACDIVWQVLRINKLLDEGV